MSSIVFTTHVRWRPQADERMKLLKYILVIVAFEALILSLATLIEL